MRFTWQLALESSGRPWLLASFTGSSTATGFVSESSFRLLPGDFGNSFATGNQILYAGRMSSYLPSADKLSQLDQRMVALGVRECDIEESFVRSGGHGGQNVNKTSTCVMLVHRPSGLQVKCQATRHQGLNRILARRLLLDKIEERQKGFVATRRAEIEKIRRQKRKRSRRAKERMLADKTKNSDKKRLRAAVMPY
jgi:peptide chain release factor